MNARLLVPLATVAVLLVIEQGGGSGRAESRAVAASFGAASLAFEAGRFDEARVQLAELVEARGAAAPAELLYDYALAAGRAGALREATGALERASELARERADSELLQSCLALHGNLAFERALLAAQQASGPEAEPFAFEVALGRARAAYAAWRDASLAGPDRPELRRNAERALRLVADLERRRAESRGEPLVVADGAAAPNLIEVDGTDAAAAGESVLGGPATGEGEPGAGEPSASIEARQELDALLVRLAEREREKVALRREKQRAAREGGGVDW